MSVFPKMKAAVCVAALMTGTTAIADVTAGDVWADWQENLALYGEEAISIGSEEASGGTVSVTDITISMSDEYSKVDATIPSVTFTENGDGTVNVAFPESYPIVMDLEGTEMTLNVFSSNMNIVAAGDPDNLTYTVSADTYGIEVAELEDVEGDMRLTANQLAGVYSVADNGDLRDLVYEIGAASLDMIVDVKEPGGDGYVVFSGKVDALEMGFEGAVPSDIDPDKPEEMFADGFGMDGGYGYAAANFLFDFNVDGEAASGTASMGNGGMNLSMNADAFGYDAGTENLAVTLQSGEFPFPISISAAEYGIGLLMPLASTEEPTDFALGFGLVDFTVNDEIWMMADPGGALPHDPATLQLDLTGTAKLFFDLLDPAQAEAMAFADVPGELHSVMLNNLNVAIAGAMLTGEGAFTFDNSDLETFGGVPRPTGEVTVEINGANALIDNLVAMGLLPEDEAMMGRMMMGMFARTVGDDMLTSTLEINEEGHVLANGQRIQ